MNNLNAEVEIVIIGYEPIMGHKGLEQRNKYSEIGKSVFF